jgi:hypothetical protein
MRNGTSTGARQETVARLSLNQGDLITSRSRRTSDVGRLTLPSSGRPASGGSEAFPRADHLLSGYD